MYTEYEVKTDYFHLAENYLGKWVALHPETSKVVAVGDNGLEAFRRAVELGVTGPIVMRVTNDYGAYVIAVSARSYAL